MDREAAGVQPIQQVPILSSYFELTKPRLTAAALLTTFLGFYMGLENGMDWGLLFHTLFGAALIGGASNALNEFIEKDIDAKMKRTENRPIPSGRVSDKGALIFGLALSVFGTLYLFAFVNFLTSLFALTTLLGYTLVYTPLKQRTWLNTFVGAVPGALPVLIGWAATGSRFGFRAGLLFLILFLWQLSHFFAIAWVYREDYRRGGLKMLSVSDADGKNTALSIVFWAACLAIAGIAPAFSGMAGPWYLGASILSGIFFTTASVFIVRNRLANAKRFLPLSVLYLIVMIVFMTVNKA